jgi:hypothetical protein
LQDVNVIFVSNPNRRQNPDPENGAGVRSVRQASDGHDVFLLTEGMAGFRSQPWNELWAYRHRQIPQAPGGRLNDPSPALPGVRTAAASAYLPSAAQA